MAHGGKRKGSGRKKLHDEIKSRDLAIDAIIETYGDQQKGFEALLKSEEATLIKWVFEKAYGKPENSIDITTGGNQLPTTIVISSPDESEG